MTDESRLAELERLCEAATPGPWYSDGLLFIGVDANGYGRGGFNLDGGPVPGAGEDGPYNYSEEEVEANTNFIVAARTTLPELLAEVRRLQVEAELYKTYHRLARKALIDVGYYRESEVGDDLAPRIMELKSSLFPHIGRGRRP